MTGIEIVARVAELQKQYDDAHRPTRSLDAYREPRQAPPQARLRRRVARLPIPAAGLKPSSFGAIQNPERTTAHCLSPLPPAFAGAKLRLRAGRSWERWASRIKRRAG
jgi:hypothetical protein